MNEIETKVHDCTAIGLLSHDKETKKVAVGMEWHLDHDLSQEFKTEFLKLRCRALQEVFGDIKGVQGIVKILPLGADSAIAMLAPGNEGDSNTLVIKRPKPCLVVMGFIWPNVDQEKWLEVKEKFKDVFAPATLHGGEPCEETESMIKISTQFNLVEKGTH